MDKERIYCGTAKQIKFDNGGTASNIILSLDTLIEEYENYGFKNEQGKRKIKVKLTQRKQPDNFGNTHYVTINTWKPPVEESIDPDDDIPF